MQGREDDQIIKMLRDPESGERGFRLLMDTWKERIYWHIRRLVVSHEEAEDVLQETFINVYRFAGSFKGESKLSTWIYRIATNECIRWLRKHRIPMEKYKYSRPVTGSNEGYEPVEEEEIVYKFQQAIMQLPEKQRIVFNLRYYDELNYEDIGQILNSPVNALKTNYHYAKEKIREYLLNN
jgi:RNA polymerase sigma-70 factor (ECF subfamily)